MNVLLHPTYFPNIAHFAVMIQAEHISFEICDNYQKQTYRNRTSIYGANGKLDLNIPVIYSQKNRQLFKNIEIFNADNWQMQHLKSLESAYRTSPFFEYYIDDLLPLFHSKTMTLMDFNFKCLDIIFKCLQVPFHYDTTERYEQYPVGINDVRLLANSRKEMSQNFKSYAQVFDDKHGFISNLSILDVLFNEGPNTELYLQSIDVNF